MGLYIFNGENFENVRKKDFETEGIIEDWLFRDPSPVVDDEILLPIYRQPVTDQRKYCDILALDRFGNPVIIELKITASSREVIAQALEYGAWVSKLKYEELGELYNSISTRANELLNEAHNDFFGWGDESSIAPDDFNKTQRLAIVAKSIDDTTLEVAKYLRTYGNIDISCVSYSLFPLDDNRYLFNTQIEVGFEDLGTVSDAKSVSPAVFIDTLKYSETKELAKSFFGFINSKDNVVIRPRKYETYVKAHNKNWCTAVPTTRSKHFMVYINRENIDLPKTLIDRLGKDENGNYVQFSIGTNFWVRIDSEHSLEFVKDCLEFTYIELSNR